MSYNCQDSNQCTPEDLARIIERVINLEQWYARLGREFQERQGLVDDELGWIFDKLDRLDDGR